MVHRTGGYRGTAALRVLLGEEERGIVQLRGKKSLALITDKRRALVQEVADTGGRGICQRGFPDILGPIGGLPEHPRSYLRLVAAHREHRRKNGFPDAAAAREKGAPGDGAP